MSNGGNGLLPIPLLAWMGWVRSSLNIKSSRRCLACSGLHNMAKSTLRPLAGSRTVLMPSLVWLGSLDKTEALKRKYERLFWAWVAWEWGRGARTPVSLRLKGGRSP